MSTNRKTYSSESKREALELVATSGKTVTELVRDLGLGEGTLRLWVQGA
jgi:transposase